METENFTKQVPIISTLKNKIIKKIRQSNGSISFADFMQMALYTPQLGYYQNSRPKIGAQGDFITAPELGPWFATCIAHHCLKFSELFNRYTILELGAGTGQLAFDFLAACKKMQSLPQSYLILEPSAYLQQLQKDKLQGFVNSVDIQWLTTLPSKPITGIILANEVLDALPVNCFELQYGKLYERCVTYHDSEFAWQLSEPSDSLQQAVTALNLSGEIFELTNYCSEINLLLPAWLESISACLQQGEILFFDYGFPAQTFYHPTRNKGTLMCHYQHRAHSDPFKHIGMQDITAHVDFTAIEKNAIQQNFSVKSYVSLAKFLFENDLINIIQRATNQSQRLSYTAQQQINTLCSPAEMGELIKAIILEKIV